MRTVSLLIVISFLFGCGGIQEARFYNPVNSMQTLPSKEWGDGLAVAHRDVCVWVYDGTALYLALTGGPIGVPVLPLGLSVAGKIDHLSYLDLYLSIVPGNDFRFDPIATFVEFENGITKQPQFVLKIPNRDGIPLTEPVDVLFLSQFFMHFEKPDNDIGPRKLRIEGITTSSGEKRVFEFAFEEVTKHRYVMTGQGRNSEWLTKHDEVDVCHELLKKNRDQDRQEK